MKYSLLFLFIISHIGCSKQTEIKTISISEFPTHWYKLTKLNSDTVVFKPCDAANRNIWITNTDDLWILNIEEGHETSYDTITSLIKIDSNKLKINVNPQYPGEPTEFYITIIKQDQLAIWTWTIRDIERTELFATESGKDLFQFIEQPCNECWDEEVCDEKEKKKHADNIDDSIEIINPIDSIEIIYVNYINKKESVDSKKNKELMKKSIRSLDQISDTSDLEVLINVWMYYDPTDFPSRNLVFEKLSENPTQSIAAIKARIDNKFTWESEDVAPLSELNYLKEKLENLNE